MGLRWTVFNEKPLSERMEECGGREPSERHDSIRTIGENESRRKVRAYRLILGHRHRCKVAPSAEGHERKREVI